MKSAQEFYNIWLYGGYDIDNSYGLQCVDGAKIWMSYFIGSWQATATGWAEAYATNKTNRDWFLSKGCTWITNIKQLKNGDLCIWSSNSSYNLSHVGMYYNGQIFGMNQSADVFTLETLSLDILGAWRPPNGTCLESYIAPKKTKKTKSKTKKAKKKVYKDFYKEVLKIDKNAPEPQILENFPAGTGQKIKENIEVPRLLGYDLTAFLMLVSLLFAIVKRLIKSYGGNVKKTL